MHPLFSMQHTTHGRFSLHIEKEEPRLLYAIHLS
jgi:hypothetical protein